MIPHRVAHIITHGHDHFEPHQHLKNYTLTNLIRQASLIRVIFILTL